MISVQHLKTGLALILNTGIFLSLALVMIGGIILIYQHAYQPMSSMLLQPDQMSQQLQQLWHPAWPLSPIYLIELGIVALVSTQILRMLLLAIYYLATGDIWFTCFSVFILITMIASLFINNN